MANGSLEIMRLSLGKTQALVTCPTGASHLDKEQPCQDACMVTQQFYRGQPYMVLAVADGHGSDKYTRSEIGAHLAMEAVHQAAADLVMSLVELKKTDEKNLLSNARKDINDRFQRQLMRYWKERVIAHAQQEDAPKDNITADSEASIGRYGTTLVVAVVFENWVILGALGDSSIFITYENNSGIHISERLKNPDMSVGTGTDSTVSRHAVYLWRTEIMPIKTEYPLKGTVTLKMLLLTSDGMTDSLGDTTEKAIKSIYDNAKTQGIDWLAGVLPQHLAQWSKDGVGDDMGCVVLFPNFSRTPKPAPSAPNPTAPINPTQG